MQHHLKVLITLSILLLFPLWIGTAEAKKKRKSAFRAACSKDVTRYCKKVRKGKGRIKKCLKKKGSKVSRKCRFYLATGKLKKATKRAKLKKSKNAMKRPTGARLIRPSGTGSSGSSRTSGTRTSGSSTSSTSGSSTSTSSTSTSGTSTSTSGSSSGSSNCNPAENCYRSNDCCPDSSATGERLKVLQKAKLLLDSYLKKRSTYTSRCDREKNLYYPRQCTGFVIDAFWQAGLIDIKWMKHVDWNASYNKNYSPSNCGSGAGQYQQTAASTSQRTTENMNNGSWRPNMNVKYMRDTYCSSRSGSNMTTASGCVHPWTRVITDESKVKAGDLWISSGHVGIVYDPSRKIMVHNAMSTGPTMDRWDNSYYKSRGTHFVRFYNWD